MTGHSKDDRLDENQTTPKEISPDLRNEQNNNFKRESETEVTDITRFLF